MILLNHYTMIQTSHLKTLYGVDCFICAQVRLRLNINIACCSVNKDAAAAVGVRLCMMTGVSHLDTISSLLTASSRCEEVINEDSLSSMLLVCRKDTSSVLNQQVMIGKLFIGLT